MRDLRSQIQLPVRNQFGQEQPQKQDTCIVTSGTKGFEARRQGSSQQPYVISLLQVSSSSAEAIEFAQQIMVKTFRSQTGNIFSETKIEHLAKQTPKPSNQAILRDTSFHSRPTELSKIFTGHDRRHATLLDLHKTALSEILEVEPPRPLTFHAPTKKQIHHCSRNLPPPPPYYC